MSIHDKPPFLNARGKYGIKIPSQHWYTDKGIDVPWSVWQQPKFLFNPGDFIVEHPKLKEKLIDELVQVKSLERFHSDPFSPVVYGVAGEPSDSLALYFAAYLTLVLISKGGKNVAWVPCYGNFSNRLVENPEDIDMLVIYNLAENSSNTKIEKARDLLVMYPNIPRIVVSAGEDPITFFATKLHHKLNSLFFASSKLSKRASEII